MVRLFGFLSVEEEDNVTVSKWREGPPAWSGGNFLEKRNCDDLEKYISLGNCQLLSAALLLSV